MSLILITGGARSGKSRWAEQRATELSQLSGGNVVYLATAAVKDMEMRLRVAQHRRTRPRSWKTVEATEKLAAALLTKAEITAGTVLILDCVTLLINNVMTHEELVITEPAPAEQAVITELRSVLRVIKERRATAIIVTNEVGDGIVPDNALARAYRDVAGRVNQWLASQADGVWLVVMGYALPLHQIGTLVKPE